MARRYGEKAIQLGISPIFLLILSTFFTIFKDM